MNNLMRLLLNFAIVFAALSTYEYFYPSVLKIEHIENVNEMEPTPDEIYFYTDGKKYLFDGEKVIHITDIPNQ